LNHLSLISALRSVAALAAVCALAAAGRGDDWPGELIGTIQGEDISAQGHIHVEKTGGELRTTLFSGSDVRVKSGQASIQLREGGVIAICGPAHLSLLKSGSDLTIALEYGTIHQRVEGPPSITVFTPLVQIKPVSIGGGPTETLVDLESSGAISVRAAGGAARLEQQLTGDSVVVPQGSDVSFTDGRIESLRAGLGNCHCDITEAPAEAAGPTRPPESAASSAGTEVSRLSPPNSPQAGQKQSSASEGPIYKVLMPPLVFDASAPPVPALSAAPPEPTPATILLVRTVRIRPALVFRGRVQPAVHVPTASAAAAQPGGALPAKPPQQQATFASRVLTYLRRLWNHSS
jgi:hypothetical protein